MTAPEPARPVVIENCAIATMDGRRHDDSGAEYRDGFSDCADCAVALVDTPPAPAEKPRHHREPLIHGPFSPEDDTVELLRTNAVEAEVIAARLPGKFFAQIMPDKIGVAQVILETLPKSGLYLLQQGRNLLGINEIVHLSLGKDNFRPQGTDNLLTPVRQVRGQSGGTHGYGKAHFQDHLPAVPGHGPGEVKEFQGEAVGEKTAQEQAFRHGIVRIGRKQFYLLYLYTKLWQKATQR